MQSIILKCSPKGEGVNPIPLNYIKAEADKYDTLKQTQRRMQAMQAESAEHDGRMKAALAQQQELLKRVNAAQGAAKH